MSLMLIVGWAIVVALALLFVVQKKNFDLLALRTVDEPSSEWPSVSVLVPVRDEAHNIRRCVASLVSMEYPGELEILVLDDGSTDETAAIVTQLAAIHPRVQLLRGSDLPSGWRGKNWACHQLQQRAKGVLLLFTDAGTEHEPHSLTTAVDEAYERDADLLSLMPRQETVTFGEQLLLPLLNFFLLTFFPSFMLERSRDPKFHAANGQFLLFRRDAYDAIGGHEAIKESIVDDLSLARRVREKRLRLAVADGSSIVRCRMYRSLGEVITGFSKNLYAATGANALRAALIALLLAMLFLVPPVLLVVTRAFPFVVATILGIWLRLRVDVRTATRFEAALLHPIAIAVAIALLALSTARAIMGKPVAWKGRT